MSMIADNPTWTAAERYRRARLLAGMEQAELAAALGVARATVSAWETGRTEPSMSNFVRIARLTGQPLEWFAAGVNAETAPAVAGAVSSLSQHSVRLEGLEPPTFWLGVWSRIRSVVPRRSERFWTAERRSILADLACQVEPDAEIASGAGSAR